MVWFGSWSFLFLRDLHALGDPVDVYVWYNDKKKWFLGTITEENKYKNKYKITWDDKREKEEWVVLKEENHTQGKKNFSVENFEIEHRLHSDLMNLINVCFKIPTTQNVGV
jgi:hypothetical protein